MNATTRFMGLLVGSIKLVRRIKLEHRVAGLVLACVETLTSDIPFDEITNDM